MLYKPENGCMWDPTVLWYGGKYHLVSMYKVAPDAPDDYMWLAQSVDGVHWESVDTVLNDGHAIYKMYIYETEHGIAMNCGSSSQPERRDNDTLRYYRSDDMQHWQFYAEDHPDSKWYHTNGRWDHMYVFRDDDGTYYGYPVATPLPEQKSAWGLRKSTDGIHWDTCPPPVIHWGDIPRINCLEVGGVEKIGSKYYFIGGYVGYAGNYGYSLYTFTADRPEGPFTPDKDAFRLCGFDRLEDRLFIQNLAAFARGKDGELLISNAAQAGDLTNVWLLPMRKAVVDEKGHLRLGYWHGNDALKGGAKPALADAQRLIFADLQPTNAIGFGGTATRFAAKDGGFSAAVCTPGHSVLHDRDMLVLLDEKLDLEGGIIMECTIRATSSPAYDSVNCTTQNWRPASVGVYLEEECCPDELSRGMAITLEVGHPYKRYSFVENIRAEKEDMHRQVIDTIGEGCAEVRGIDADCTVRLRLLYRRNMFELYADDLLVQSFVHLGTPTGKIGICLRNAAVEVTDWTVYPMV